MHACVATTRGNKKYIRHKFTIYTRECRYNTVRARIIHAFYYWASVCVCVRERGSEEVGEWVWVCLRVHSITVPYISPRPHSLLARRISKSFSFYVLCSRRRCAAFRVARTR